MRNCSSDRSVDDFDLYVVRFTDFGKEFPKTQNMSPDAFIQLALQLTYYKSVIFSNQACITLHILSQENTTLYIFRYKFGYSGTISKILPLACCVTADSLRVLIIFGDCVIVLLCYW